MFEVSVGFDPLVLLLFAGLLFFSGVRLSQHSVFDYQSRPLPTTADSSARSLGGRNGP